MLGGCADEGDGTHHGDGVEAGAGEEGWLEEEEGGEDGGLGDVEAGPEGVFLDVAVTTFVSCYSFLFLYWDEGEGGRHTCQAVWQRSRTWCLCWLLDRIPARPRDSWSLI